MHKALLHQYMYTQTHMHHTYVCIMHVFMYLYTITTTVTAAPGESEEAFAKRLAAEVEDVIVREGPDTVGVFIAEPLMGAGVWTKKKGVKCRQAKTQKHACVHITKTCVHT